MLQGREIFFAVFFGAVQLLLMVFVISTYLRASKEHSLCRVNVPGHYFQRIIYHFFIMLPSSLIFPFLSFFQERAGEEALVYLFMILGIIVIYLLTYYIYTLNEIPRLKDKKEFFR